ncbi:hypothetical protein PoB_003236100 [Plakobranchus ocellatus]|uniref:Uncharacterized protein n=1 Tax=Plakobranchus ocellatus TaxID=259542 RepID=A0AAV4ABY4_9GAST|nr:hypothetical protein PoB_003236100 [Plakobranchus ocellatus]
MYCADKRMSNKPVDVTMRLLQPLLDQGNGLHNSKLFVQTTILLNKHRTQHRRRRTNLASVLKEVSVALVDKDVTYAPQADNVPIPMDRLKGRHFLSMCPSSEASDSRGKKAQRQCKVCADRAKTAGQTPTVRDGKES